MQSFPLDCQETELKKEEKIEKREQGPFPTGRPGFRNGPKKLSCIRLATSTRPRAQEILFASKSISSAGGFSFFPPPLPATCPFPLARKFFIATIGPPHASLLRDGITKRYFISMQRARTRGQSPRCTHFYSGGLQITIPRVHSVRATPFPPSPMSSSSLANN